MKREDLTHTGAHKINNALGQALLAARMGKTRVVAETGAGQHGVASATACALLGLECVVYMAGGTSSGPSGAREALFDGRFWFLLTAQASPDAVTLATGFVRDLGAVPVPLEDNGDEHDRLVGAISHLPQVVATTLRARVGETVGVEGLRHAGAGLRDTTRRAASHASMWAPILATNATALAPLLRTLADDLTRVAQELGDREAMEELFARAHRFPFDP